MKTGNSRAVVGVSLALASTVQAGMLSCLSAKEYRLRGLVDGSGDIVGSPTLECE